MRRHWLLSFLGALIFALYLMCSVTALALTEAEGLYNDAIDQYNRGDLNEALESLTRAIKLDPKYTDFYIFRGVIFHELGKNDEAIADFNAAISLNPSSKSAYKHRGDAREFRGIHDEAIADYTKAISIDPEYAEAYNGRGKVYAGRDQFNEAIKDYNMAIELEPNNGQFYVKRGVAYEGLGKLNEAITDYNKAFRLEPDSWYINVTIGGYYDTLGKYKDAIVYYTNSIPCAFNNSTLWSSHKYRAECYKNTKQYEKSIADYTEMIRIHPDYGWPYYDRSQAFKALGKKEQYLEDLKKACDNKMDEACDELGNIK